MQLVPLVVLEERLKADVWLLEAEGARIAELTGRQEFHERQEALANPTALLGEVHIVVAVRIFVVDLSEILHLA